MSDPPSITSPGAFLEEIFSEDGTLSTRSGFEFRPQQLSMASGVLAALEEQSHLIVEAPTGVGKSLAYLIPAVLYALCKEKVVVISTHTKNLQEQILRHDIPLARSLIGQDFRAVVVKGRRNYLCTTRLRHVAEHTAQLFDEKGNRELDRIVAWSRTTRDGDRDALGFMPSPGVWESVCSEQDVCVPPRCGSECFYQRMRARVRTANIIIMNHALFFTLLPMQSEEGQHPYDIVIFDEAHTIERIAAAGIGKRLTRHQFLSTLHRLWNPNTRRGLLYRKRTPARDLCRAAEEVGMDFFDRLRVQCETLAGRSERGPTRKEIRIRQPLPITSAVDGTLERLENTILELEGRERSDDVAQEFSSVRRTLSETRNFLGEFLHQSNPILTYWVEIIGQRGEQIALCTSPTDISGVIGPLLFRPGSSVVMTSATLSVNNSLHYFKHRIGALTADDLLLDSPFHHDLQMKLVLARGIPAPDTPAFERELPRWILSSVERSGGRALVLFTSTVLMNAMASALREPLQERGYRLLVQGTTIERHALLERFKEDISSVLFGLDSFWMGIDVPGEALEHVIITRLPFTVPNHPLIESRLEEIARRGGNPFMEYTLPEAILKFRQGVGRLLRSGSDRGVVTVLDERIHSKQYGRLFLQSIPRCPVEITNADGETEYVEFQTP
jgi:ATP-dependent DNA helicase DinG